MKEKRTEIIEGSSEEIEMRMSLLALVTLGRQIQYQKPLHKVVSSIRNGILMAQYALQEGKGATTVREQHDTLITFADPDEWMRYFAQIYDTDILVDYANTVLDEQQVIAQVAPLLQGISLDVAANEAPKGIERKSEISVPMQIRMWAELSPYLDKLGPATMLSDDGFEEALLCNLKGCEDFIDDAKFRADPEERREHGSFRHWFGYYIQEYSTVALKAFVMKMRELNLEKYTKKLISEKGRLIENEWEVITSKHPHLRGHRAASEKIIQAEIFAKIEEFVKNKVWQAYPKVQEIRYQDIDSIKIQLDRSTGYILFWVKFCNPNEQLNNYTENGKVFIQQILDEIDSAGEGVTRIVGSTSVLPKGDA